jgi:hypothetical protein
MNDQYLWKQPREKLLQEATRLGIIVFDFLDRIQLVWLILLKKRSKK